MLENKIYQQDNIGNLIINDNCLNILYNIPDNSIEYCLTSPPYNRKRNDKYKNFRDINNDWYQLNVDVIKQLLRITKNHIFYNIQANFYNKKDVYKLIGTFHENIIDIHIWQKSNPIPSSGKNITNAVEYFIILGKSPLKSNFNYTKNIITTSVNSKMPKEHKAVMKPEVAEHFIINFTKENDTILDPFFGMGTTGIISKKYNRKFIGIELDNDYFIKSCNICF